jgi:hypothetical protein
MIEIEAVVVVNSLRSGSGPTLVRRPGKLNPRLGEQAPKRFGSCAA